VPKYEAEFPFELISCFGSEYDGKTQNEESVGLSNRSKKTMRERSGEGALKSKL
jgi:hypothetical protein